jgi:predicted SnoaL-like aldol condensation-catalyzing enzyme
MTATPTAVPAGATADAAALLQRLFDEVINRGHLEVVDELLTEDYIDHGPWGDMAGPEAFRQLVAGWRAAVPDVHCEIDHVFTDGDMVGWLVHTTGTHTGDGLGFPATNRRFSTVSTNLGRIRAGRAVEHWAEHGMFSMLVQLGVIPQAATTGA